MSYSNKRRKAALAARYAPLIEADVADGLASGKSSAQLLAELDRDIEQVHQGVWKYKLEPRESDSRHFRDLYAAALDRARKAVR